MIARRDDEGMLEHFEEEQRSEHAESRRKPTGANLFDVLAKSRRQVAGAAADVPQFAQNLAVAPSSPPQPVQNFLG